MSERDDREGVLHRFVTRDQAERLLSPGSSGTPTDTGFADVAALFSAMREPATPEETVVSQPALAAFTAALREGPRAATPAHRQPVKAKFRKRKALVAVATTAVLFGGAAAAATGSLPGPVQDSVSRSLSHIGMDVPDSHDSSGSTADAPNVVAAAADDSPVTTDSAAVTTSDAAPAAGAGPSVDVDDSAKKGLCTAYAASSGSSGKNVDSPAFRNLSDAATKAGKSIDDYCAESAAPTTSDDTGKPDDTGKTDDTGKPDDAGKPNDPAANGNSDKTDKADKTTGKPDDIGKTDKGGKESH